jgi:hypothetical protein
MGKRVLCLTITGHHSGTFNAAHLAAQRFGEVVEVFDSLGHYTNTTNSFIETEYPTSCFALSPCSVPASLHGRPDVDRTLARMA